MRFGAAAKGISAVSKGYLMDYGRVLLKRSYRKKRTDDLDLSRLLRHQDSIDSFELRRGDVGYMSSYLARLSGTSGSVQTAKWTRF